MRKVNYTHLFIFHILLNLLFTCKSCYFLHLPHCTVWRLRPILIDIMWNVDIRGKDACEVWLKSYNMPFNFILLPCVYLRWRRSFNTLTLTQYVNTCCFYSVKTKEKRKEKIYHIMQKSPPPLALYNNSNLK